MNYTHYDLHPKNIMIQELDEEVQIKYTIFNEDYYIYTKYLVKIIDFGTSFYRRDNKSYGISPRHKYNPILRGQYNYQDNLWYDFYRLYMFMIIYVEYRRDLMVFSEKIWRFFNENHDLYSENVSQKKRLFLIFRDFDTSIPPLTFIRFLLENYDMISEVQFPNIPIYDEFERHISPNSLFMNPDGIFAAYLNEQYDRSLALHQSRSIFNHAKLEFNKVRTNIIPSHIASNTQLKQFLWDILNTINVRDMLLSDIELISSIFKTPRLQSQVYILEDLIMVYKEYISNNMTYFTSLGLTEISSMLTDIMGNN